MIITRTVKNKKQVFESKGKALNYDISKSIRFSHIEWERFENICKSKGVKVGDEIRRFVKEYE